MKVLQVYRGSVGVGWRVGVTGVTRAAGCENLCARKGFDGFYCLQENDCESLRAREKVLAKVKKRGKIASVNSSFHVQKEKTLPKVDTVKKA
ncbi:MAG: hypothetical protein D6712_10105 [Chloroflexi bacterium]|nr:MAG: hypothetical protein D6712_10105 [Chloroflexota bacterium]